MTNKEKINWANLPSISREEAAGYFKENLPLATKNLIIRPFQDSDLSYLANIIINMRNYAKNHADSGYRTFYFFDNNEESTQVAQNFLDKATREYTTGETMRLAVCLRPQKNEYTIPIGNVTVDIPENGKISPALFSPNNHQAPLQGDLGYFLAPHAMQKGYATEAIKAIIHLYLSLMYPHITFTIHPENKPSRALAERLGAVQIGSIPESDHNGEPRDIYSITKEPRFLTRQNNFSQTNKTGRIL